MQNIRTTYEGPTNYQGSRVVARLTLPSGRRCQVTVPYSYELTAHGEHQKAANILASRVGFALVGDAVAETRTGKGYIFTVSPAF